jgi:hypothetical protein
MSYNPPLTAGLVSGSQPLGAGVKSGSVAGLGLSAVPSRVVVSVSRPLGEDFLFAMVNTGSLTADGFTFELSSQTTSANFVLDYLIVP